MDLERRVEQIEEKQNEVRAFLFGNGGVGVDERLRRLEKHAEAARQDSKLVQAQLHQLTTQNAAQQAFRRGAMWAIGLSVTILTILQAWAQISNAQRTQEIMQLLRGVLSSGLVQ